jgi:hypothetical protein
MDISDIKQEFIRVAHSALHVSDPATVETWLNEAIASLYQRQISDPPPPSRCMASWKAIISDIGDICDVEYEICDNVVGLAWSLEEHGTGVHMYTADIRDLSHAVFVGITQGDVKGHQTLETQGIHLRLKKGEQIQSGSFLERCELEMIPFIMNTDQCILQVTIDYTVRHVTFVLDGVVVLKVKTLNVAQGTRFALSNSGFGGRFRITYEDRTHLETRRFLTISPRNVGTFKLYTQRTSRGVITSEGEDGLKLEFENYASSVGVMLDARPLAQDSKYKITVQNDQHLWFGVLESSEANILARTACEVKPLCAQTLAIHSKGVVTCPSHVTTFTVINEQVPLDSTNGITLALVNGQVLVNDIPVANVDNTKSTFHFGCSNDGMGATATIYRLS